MPWAKERRSSEARSTGEVEVEVEEAEEEKRVEWIVPVGSGLRCGGSVELVPVG